MVDGDVEVWVAEVAVVVEAVPEVVGVALLDVLAVAVVDVEDAGSGGVRKTRIGADTVEPR